MKRQVLCGAFAVCLSSLPVLSQQAVLPEGGAPIYRVTVVERTVKAVNYQYRGEEPARIDFRGTVLMPLGKGDAWVESKRGHTEIDAHVEHLSPSQGFGREYLTYVLWAITPEGRPHNLGEFVPSGSGSSHLRVSTDLQAFAMIVTAEPYSAVRTPSDVVVMENQIRPDTYGKIVSVDAKYELLPRGQYTWQVSDSLSKELANTPKVSSGEYDALLELYQAENAVGIAGTAGAEQYAPNTYAKAKELLASARSWHRKDGDNRRVVEFSRESAQTAEDARVIAQQRQQEEKLRAASTDATRARQEIANAELGKQRAEAEARQARADAESAAQRAEAERAARNRAEADAAAARAQAAQAAAAAAAPPVIVAPSRSTGVSAAAQAANLRSRVYEELNAVVAVRDTPRGLVAIVPDADFNGGTLTASAWVARIAPIVARHPGLRVSCEGHTSADHSEALSRQRAEAVRSALLASGLAASDVTAAGYGNTRPLESNATAEGREQNSRVEIVIAGDPIGAVPFWDRTYPLTGKR